MKQRARFPYLLGILIVALIQFSACSGKPSTFNRVTISPSGTIFIGQGGINPVLISANVLNDAALNGGVNFVLAPVGVGTLTQTSSTTASYFAPATVNGETVVTITATSVDFPGQSAVLTVKIEPPPSITTTSLPTATLGQAYTGPITATGGVPPFSWALTSGTFPAGLSLGSSKTDTVNVTGTPTAQGNGTITVTITDSAGSSSTSLPLTIVVSNLAFTTTSPLPPAQVTTPPTTYSTQFAATGGTGALTFTVANGSSLPAGFTLLSNGDLSGAPTAQEQGSFTFGITVTDSGIPPASITQSFTLVINGPQNLLLLSGPYAFSFSGNNSAGYLAAAGTFTADGNGGISGGEADFTSQSGHTNPTAIMGTYTAGTDGRGIITFANVAGTPTFAFAIDPGGSGHGRLIEFDAAPIVTRGSGRLEAQAVSTCVVSSGTNNTYTGTFAFGGSGAASTFAAGGAGPIGFAGTFTATPPIGSATQGSLANAEMDSNAPNNATSGATSISGLYQSGPDTSHCTIALSASSLSDPNYSVYPISASDAFLVETDPVNATTPNITVAEMKQQIGQPFLSNPMNGAMVGGVSGEVSPGGTLEPYVAAIQIVPTTGLGSFSYAAIDNTAGTVTSTNGTPFSVTYTSDQFGRIDTGGFVLNGEFEPIFYLVNQNEAFCVGVFNGGPVAGHFDPQILSAFTVNTLQGPLVEGTSAPAVSAERDISGFLTFDGTVTPATIGGIQDESTTTANMGGETVTGTFALSATGTTDGSGTVTLSSPAAFTGAFFIASPTEMVLITTTTKDANPVLIIVGHE